MNNWLEEAFNLDPSFARGVQFVIALLIVLGLNAIFIWIMRRISGGGIGRAPRNRQPRIAVMDHAALDARRRLILIRRDNIEHLLLVGGPSDVVVEQNIVRGQPTAGYSRIGQDHQPQHQPHMAPQHMEPPQATPAPHARRPPKRHITPSARSNSRNRPGPRSCRRIRATRLIRDIRARCASLRLPRSGAVRRCIAQRLRKQPDMSRHSMNRSGTRLSTTQNRRNRKHRWQRRRKRSSRASACGRSTHSSTRRQSKSPPTSPQQIRDAAWA